MLQNQYISVKRINSQHSGCNPGFDETPHDAGWVAHHSTNQSRHEVHTAPPGGLSDCTACKYDAPYTPASWWCPGCFGGDSVALALVLVLDPALALPLMQWQPLRTLVLTQWQPLALAPPLALPLMQWQPLRTLASTQTTRICVGANCAGSNRIRRNRTPSLAAASVDSLQ